MEKETYTLKDSFYKLLLIGILFFLLFNNVSSLLNSFVFLSVIPMILQVSILILIYLKHKYLKIMIKIWSIILFISGFAGMVSTVASYLLYRMDNSIVYEKQLGLPFKVFWAAQLIAGTYFYVFLKDNLVKSKEEIDNSSNGQIEKISEDS